MLNEKFTIKGIDLPLRASLSRAAAGSPLVILVHGFKGFMDWGCWPWVAAQFRDAGLSCLRFNFSHNGIGDDPLAFTELERFQANTYSREVAELGCVMAAAAALDGIDPARIHLLGHSRGGAIALLASEGAAQVVTWASLAGLEGLMGFRGQEAAWRRDGFVEARNARTGQVMRLGVGLLEDWEANREALDVTAALSRFTTRGGKATAIHGDADQGVPLEHGLRLQAAGARLVTIPGGDHTFGSTHPFQAEPPAPLKAAMAATLDALLH
jgi:pimeloyl-ACP methyl ester carboxylesterase